MKPAKILIKTAFLLFAGLAPATALAAGLSVSVGGVSVSTGSSASTTATGASATLNGTATSEQEAALAAVKSQHALSLDKIYAAARQYANGDIIDAQLVTVRGFLLYDLKVLDTKGDVSDLYFYAQSGKIVETN